MSYKIKSYDKEDVINNMKTIHDEIKNHPYRINETKTKGYKNLLLDLSDEWGKYQHCCKHDAIYEKKLHLFTFWFHEFNGCIESHLNEPIKSEYIPFIEAIIGITHVFVDTGDLTYTYFMDRKNCIMARYEWNEEFQDYLIVKKIQTR